jgi:hypothetical protein
MYTVYIHMYTHIHMHTLYIHIYTLYIIVCYNQIGTKIWALLLHSVANDIFCD